MAIFRIESGFRITGRGFVIAGDIIEGMISAGNQIFTSEMEPLNGRVIRSVEFIDNILIRTTKIGLIIHCQTEAELKELESLICRRKE